MEVLFKTIHGSRLYNLAHSGSDTDYFTVIANRPRKKARYAKQKVYENGEDSLVMDFSSWLQSCTHGTPQALEAMFSTLPSVDRLSAYRAGFRVSTNVVPTYLRTIKNFCYTQEFKRKRHALRLAINLRDLGRYGRFNPTLTDSQVEYISAIAEKDTDIVYAYCMNIGLP